MVRKKAPSFYKKEHEIEWRSHEPLRLETFSDAVFAFAVTLIIVSLEVPKTFSELYIMMQGTISFAVCFAVLFNIWHHQNIFFRRYGLNDTNTVALNAILLFVVLIYVYPLKFLAALIFSGNTQVVNGHSYDMIGAAQTPTLMLIYGAGFTCISLLFCLMYANAFKYREELKLTEKEIFTTRTEMIMNLWIALIGVGAIIFAYVLPTDYAGLSGFFYMLIPVAYTAWLSYRGKKARHRFGVNVPPVS